MLELDCEIVEPGGEIAMTRLAKFVKFAGLDSVELLRKNFCTRPDPSENGKKDS